MKRSKKQTIAMNILKTAAILALCTAVAYLCQTSPG